MTGWGIMMADLVIMPSLAQISSSYLFRLFGANGLAASVFWTTLVGIVFIMGMTWICVVGIELNAKTQVGLLGAELAVLVVFSVVALARVYSGAFSHSVTPSLSWLIPFSISDVSGITAGILVSVFIYWGWDTAVTVNEETSDANRTPGLAAVLSTVILFLIYVVTSFAAQAVHGAEFLTNNSDDVISSVGKDVLGGFFDRFLIIAVLTSAAASCQTTILPAARSALSMSAHKAAPPWFGKINPARLTPANATWAFGIGASAWYLGLVLLGGDVLTYSITGVGLMIAFYGMTGFACVLYSRRYLLESVKNFIFVGLMPLVGALILTWIFLKSLLDLADPDNSGGVAWFGLGPPFVIGGVLLLMGIPLMLIWRARNPAFFRVKSDPIDKRPPLRAATTTSIGARREGA